MTPELFMQWKKKKIEEREVGLAAMRAERAKNDRMRCSSPLSRSFSILGLLPSSRCSLGEALLLFSGRELFMSDASLFVDDVDSYEKYQRDEDYDIDAEKVSNLWLRSPNI